MAFFIFTRQINSLNLSLRWRRSHVWSRWIDNEWARNGNAMGRAAVADNAATFTAMMPTKNPRELLLTDRTLGNLRVRLPGRNLVSS